MSTPNPKQKFIGGRSALQAPRMEIDDAIEIAEKIEV
jgi:hypothetical protein